MATQEDEGMVLYQVVVAVVGSSAAEECCLANPEHIQLLLRAYLVIAMTYFRSPWSKVSGTFGIFALSYE